MFAHYLARYDGGRYADILLNGDIHQENADKIGITRRQVKTVTYCFLYGGGNQKLGLSYDNMLSPEEAKALNQLKAFLTELQKNKELLNAIRVAATANEIAEIASEFGYQFSGDELKAASKENIAGVKIKKQDTSPSYSFGESGIDPNEKNYKSGN